jgi:hypothetical protein
MTVALWRAAPTFRVERAPCRRDFALRARADYVGEYATVIDRRYIHYDANPIRTSHA